MGLYSAFDEGFDGTEVSATISRKAEDGKVRTARLTGAVPTGMSLEEFAEAARQGLRRALKTKDRGVTLAKAAPELKGDRAFKAVLSLGDPVPDAKPDTVPEAVRRRGRHVQPSDNGTATADNATGNPDGAAK